MELLLDVDCEVVNEPLDVEPDVPESEPESDTGESELVSESVSASEESESDVSVSSSESASIVAAELEAAAPEEVCDGFELVEVAAAGARLLRVRVELCEVATGVAVTNSD